MSLHTLMFGWEYPPLHCGGLGVACQGIVRGLLANGAQVTLVLPHDASIEDGASVVFPTEEQKQLAALGQISVTSLLKPYDSEELYKLRYSLLESSDRVSAAATALYGEDLGAEVERFTAMAVDMTKHVHPDIIHSHDWMTIEAGVRASRHHHKPLIAHVHATELDRTEFKPNQWIFGREKWGLQQANHIIAVSDYTKRLLINEYGISGDKISVLHNGTSEIPAAIPGRPDRAHHHPLVLFLGRLTVQKGAQYFLRAARSVADHAPHARFVIAGEGYLSHKLIDEACRIGLADRVLFAGKVSDSEARKLYQHASCFVMPSVSEPFGLVALEAITHGAPVVLSKQSGAAEVVKNALIVDFWDTDKMADCILTILREEPLRKQMRSETHHVLSNLTWNRQAGKILSIYKNVKDQT